LRRRVILVLAIAVLLVGTSAAIAGSRRPGADEARRMTEAQKMAVEPAYQSGGTIADDSDTPLESFGVRTINYPLVAEDTEDVLRLLRAGIDPPLRMRPDGKQELIRPGDSDYPD